MITKTEIAELFKKQLAQIDDPGLRDQVVEVWLVGCERGGWESLEELKKIPFTLLTDTKGVTFIEHTIAVAEGAVGLAKAQIDAYKNVPYKIDMDRLIAAGILHDVGKLMEIEPDGAGGYRKSHSGRCARHPISGA
ncbi:MAG: HD domain-containing protein, partial [bacterium]|nr:HD domain-containing protein [bacterium]